ncbi:vWA domain-containing protein [Thalassococcus sp. BH17M4-6]|uniref:vWA domain-containing protein n=1 Tax=Thalassococcus sp. BH17M4-6 TaxID=3413148 RepID=UPI003BEDA14C
MFRTVISALAACLALAAAPAHSQSAAGNTILVLDASGSMWGQIDGTAKISIAQTVIGDLLGTLPEGQALGLTAYGHRTKGDCSDIETLVAPGAATRDAIAQAVNAVQPKGKTPMTDAVRMAAEALRYGEEKATVILVSDGIETCNPDPCAAARALEETGVDFTAHVIGFDVADPEALAQMQCLADETGGQFLTAANAAELGSALSEVVQEPQAVAVPVTFRATVGENGPEIATPLIWDVQMGSDPVVEAAQGSTLTRDLDRGDYTVSVLRPEDEESAEAQFTVENQPQTVTLVLPAMLPDASLNAAEEAVAGSTIPVTWEGPNQKSDYIAIAEIEESRYVNYTYTSKGSPAELLMPPTAGLYELRYVMAQGSTVLATRPINVTSAEASLDAADSAPAGSTLPVTWQGPDYKSDYIAVAVPGEGRYVNYTYTSKGDPAQVLLPPQPGQYELRYVMSQDNTLLATRPIEVTAVTATIDAPVQATAGETLSVGWTGPDYKSDYLAVSKPDEGGNESYTYTRDGTPLGLKVPLETGSYEIRYVMSQGTTVLAAQPLEVVAVGATLTAEETARAGAPLVVEWDGPAYKSDYISVAKPDDDRYEGYTYTREGSPMILQMPTEPGTYELRYVATGGGESVLARRPVTLEPVTATIKAAATGSAGGKLAVTWDGPDYRNDFIGLVGKGAPEGEYQSYVYTRDDSPMIMTLPEVPGIYELRYHLGDGQRVIASREVEVLAD